MNKVLEMSKRMSKGGRKRIKMILLTIHQDGEMNRNGITWKEQYVLNNLESIKGIPICATFLDEDKDSLLDHGYTETVELADGQSEPLFSNSESVGVIEDAKIEDVEIDGENKRVLVGYGYIFCQRYKNLTDKLEREIETSCIKSSIEIMGKDENNRKIIYDGGYKEQGRIPMVFDFSGTCLLGVLEADENCYVLEVAQNQNKEETLKMNEQELKQLIVDTINETNSVKADSDAKIAELNDALVEKDSKISELEGKVTELETNSTDKDEKIKELEAKITEQNEELDKIKVEKRLGELNDAISAYSEEEQKYAEAEINAFKENPLEGNIEEINAKICVGIIAKQKEDAKIAEQNSANEKDTEVVDIFSEINSDVAEEDADDTNIF